MALPWHIPLEAIKNLKSTHCPEPTLLKHFCKLNIHENPKESIQTGIMCDIGINNMDPTTIQRFITAGMTIAKLNVRNLDPEVRNQLIQSVRQAVYNYSAELNYVYPLALITEIVKPEIITGNIKGEIIELNKSQKIRLSSDISWKECGTIDCIYVGWDHLTDLQMDDIIYIDSLSSGNKIKLLVTKVGDNSVMCAVEIGGIIGSQMTVRILHVPREIDSSQNKSSSESISCSKEEKSESLTDNMQQQLEWTVRNDIDSVIISNVQSAEDIRYTKISLSEKGKHILIFSSIETILGLDNIEEILAESDGIYFDRSILSCDLPVVKIFVAQKIILAKCKAIGKPCICKVAINEYVPTMCVTDIANLIIDGLDVIALELLNDSPINKPDKFHEVHMAENCIAAASVVCRNAEHVEWLPCMYSNLDLTQSRLEEPTKVVCISAVELAMRSKAVAIICLTSSGRTAKTLSYISSICPVVAVTRACHTARQLCFWKGIQAIHYFETPKGNWTVEVESRIRAALDFCKSKLILRVGDPYVIVLGSRRNVGYCDSIRLLYASGRNSIYTEIL